MIILHSNFKINTDKLKYSFEFAELYDSETYMCMLIKWNVYDDFAPVKMMVTNNMIRQDLHLHRLTRLLLSAEFPYMQMTASCNLYVQLQQQQQRQQVQGKFHN